MALSRTHQRCRHPWPFRRVIHGIHVEIIAFENPLSINVRFSVENPLICYPLENPWQLNGTSNFHIIEVNVCEFSTKKSLQKSRYIKIRLSHFFPAIKMTFPSVSSYQDSTFPSFSQHFPAPWLCRHTFSQPWDPVGVFLGSPNSVKPLISVATSERRQAGCCRIFSVDGTVDGGWWDN